MSFYRSVSRWFVVASALGMVACGHKSLSTIQSNVAPVRGCDGGVCPIASAATPLLGCADNYAVQVLLGEQSTPFNIYIDTGSDATAVKSTDCASCSGNVRYQPTTAPLDGGLAYFQGYDGGADGWEGTAYRDRVSIIDGPTFDMNFYAVHAATSGFFSESATCVEGGQPISMDGIMGLNRQLPPSPDGTTMIQSAGQAGAVFALQQCDLGGQAWFGGYDPNATGAPLQFVPNVQGNQPPAWFGRG